MHFNLATIKTNMNTKNFTNPVEVQKFVDKLCDEQKWVIDVRTMPEGMGYTVEWQEHKTYVAYDGLEYPDEVWTTEKGVVMLVQDMSEAHVRNTLRMFLRQDREAQAGIDDVMKTISELIGPDAMDSNIEDEDPEDTIEDMFGKPTESFISTDEFNIPSGSFGVDGPTTIQ